MLFFKDGFLQFCRMFCLVEWVPIFRSRKNFSTTYAIVSFFFCRPLQGKIKFLTNCPCDFNKILNSHSTPKGAPVFSKPSKSYDWIVTNIAKICPKTAKISPEAAIFHFFFDFLKNCPNDSNEIFYTILESYMCNGIKIV